MATIRAWIRHYAGAILIMVVFGASILFFTIAYNQDRVNSNSASLYYEIAGTLATTALTAMLLGLSDIVSFVSRLVATAVMNGSFLARLSPQSRRELVRKVVEADVNHLTKEVHSPLLDKAMDLLYSYVSGPYWTNYHYKNDISVYPQIEGFFMADCSVRYKVHVAHLARLPAPYEITYVAQWEIMSKVELTNDQVVLELSVLAGNNSWGINDACIELKRLPDRTVVNVKFDKTVELVGDTDVFFRIKALQDFVDPVDLMYFKYPVRGFSASLNHDGGRGWHDASVFRPCSSGELSIAGGSPIVKSNSVEFSCSGEWAFPGSGFVFVFPRDPEKKHPPRSWKSKLGRGGRKRGPIVPTASSENDC